MLVFSVSNFHRTVVHHLSDYLLVEYIILTIFYKLIDQLEEQNIGCFLLLHKMEEEYNPHFLYVCWNILRTYSLRDSQHYFELVTCDFLVFLRYHCTLSASPSDRYNVFGMRNLLTRNMHTTRSSVSCTSISFYIIFFTLPSLCFFVYALCELHINHIFLL